MTCAFSYLPFQTEISHVLSPRIQLMNVSRPTNSLLERTFSKEDHQMFCTFTSNWLLIVMTVYSALLNDFRITNVLADADCSCLAALFYSSYSHLFLFPICKVSFYSTYLLKIKSREHIYLYDLDEEKNKQACQNVQWTNTSSLEKGQLTYLKGEIQWLMQYRPHFVYTQLT